MRWRQVEGPDEEEEDGRRALWFEDVESCARAVGLEPRVVTDAIASGRRINNRVLPDALAEKHRITKGTPNRKYRISVFDSASS